MVSVPGAPAQVPVASRVGDGRNWFNGLGGLGFSLRSGPDGRPVGHDHVPRDLVNMPSVLVVEPQTTLQQLLVEGLKPEFRVLSAQTMEEALNILQLHPVDVVLADQAVPPVGGVEVLYQALEMRPETVRILALDNPDPVLAVEAVNRAHVGRFIIKPYRLLELRAMVGGALREVSLERENRQLLRELTEKNHLLARALAQVQSHERLLEQEVERRTLELREAVVQLEQLALRDGLTGLYNHRYFQEALTMELAHAARYARPLALLFLDVDHFKNYNDVLGHPQGDELLKELAQILNANGEAATSSIRGRIYDVACRYGGEEFVVILPEADKVGGRARAERIRSQVEEFAFEGRDKQPGGKVTVSIGVASYPEDALTKKDLIVAADDALLRAKRGGRNCVRWAGQA